MSITSMDFFEIDGVSSHTVGVYVDTPPVPPMAQKRYKTYTPAGYAEDVTYATGDYDDVQIDIDCYTFEENFDPSDFYAFINSGTNLATSRYSKYIYKIKQVLEVVPDRQGYGKNHYTVSFMCSPFRYSKDDVLREYKNQVFTVNGNAPCEPVIVISIDSLAGGLEEVIMYVVFDGNSYLEIPDCKSGETITVDSEHKIVYDQSGKIRESSGIFPALEPGEHNGSIGSEYANITIHMRKNERWV